MEAINALKTKNRSKTSASVITPQLSRIALVVCIAVLCVIGVVMVYSASSVSALVDEEIQDPQYYLKRQLISLAIGLVLMVVACKIPCSVWLTRICWVPWFVVVALLVATAAFGTEGLGAQRWVSLPVIGSFQPSEFVKTAVILVSANTLSAYADGQKSRRGMALCILVAVALPAVLIVFQKDLGTIIILSIAAISCLWFGEVRVRPIILCLVALALAAIALIFSSEERRARFTAFLNPEAYSDDEGYQTLNSEYAIATGGLLGQGLGGSYLKYNYLPEAHTDFIYAIICEELGFIGGAAVVFLFLCIAAIGFHISRFAKDVFGKVLAGGCTTAIVFQAFLNILCAIGWAPVTGKPLPFISYGGSSLISSLILAGLLLAVSFDTQGVRDSRRRRNEIRVLEGGRSR